VLLQWRMRGSLALALLMLMAVPLAARRVHHRSHHRRARHHAQRRRPSAAVPAVPGTIALRFCDRRSRKGVAVFVRIVPSKVAARQPVPSSGRQRGAHSAGTHSAAAWPLFTQAGEDGHLEIALPAGRYSVEAAAPGYQPVTVEWKPDSKPNEILLIPESP
jgi:hypothetical protein